MGWYPTAQDGNNDGSEIAEVAVGLDSEFGREKNHWGNRILDLAGWVIVGHWKVFQWGVI